MEAKKESSLQIKIPETNDKYANDSSPQSPCSGRGIAIYPRVAVFVLFVMLQIFLNYDAGAIPACLEMDNKDGTKGGLIKDFDLTFTETGLLGSLMYMGLTISCLFGGSLLDKYQPKWTIFIGMLGNILCNLGFALAPNIIVLMIARFGVGLSQAFLTIYIPVWVDEFSPDRLRTTWMSLVQAGVPLGIMMGYAISGFLAANHFRYRSSFLGQVYALSGLLFIFLLTPPRFINVPKDEESAMSFASAENRAHLPEKQPGSPQSPYGSTDQQMITTETSAVRIYLAQLAYCIRRPVFILVALALSALYFVVTSIQLWVTPYLQGPPFKTDLNVVVGAFTATSATAPVGGVIIGGWLPDLLGGYQKHALRALLLSLFFGSVATLVAWIAMFEDRFYTVIVLIWIQLFCGGAIVPTCTGLLMSSVEKIHRPFASGFSMFLSTLLGYAAGPFLTGLVATWTNLRWGFRLSMGWSTIALIALGLCAYFVWKSPPLTSQEEQLITPTNTPEHDEGDKLYGGSFVGVMLGPQSQAQMWGEQHRKRSLSSSFSRPNNDSHLSASFDDREMSLRLNKQQILRGRKNTKNSQVSEVSNHTTNTNPSIESSTE